MRDDGPVITTRSMIDADTPAVVSLLERTLGLAPGGVSRADLFEWKHLRNPFGPSVARVAETEGAVVGLRSFMRWELAAGGESVMAVRAVDTATAPAVQRRGLFTRLTTEALDTCRDEGVGFVFNTPNERSRPGYMKMGWEVIGSWPLRLKVRRPDRLAVSAIRRDLRSGAGVEPRPGSALLPASAAAAGEALALAATWPQPQVLHTPRTAAYLRWRYVDGPLGYHVLIDDGAIVVVRLRARGSLREAVICEAMAAPGSLPRLARLVAGVGREAGADHSIAHIGQGWPGAAVMGRAGFHLLPRAGLTFTVRPISATEPDPRHPSAWALTLGDLEVF